MAIDLARGAAKGEATTGNLGKYPLTGEWWPMRMIQPDKAFE